jgi:hypothetical protein
LSFWFFLVFVFTVPWQNAVELGDTKTLSSLIGIAALVVALATCFLEGRVTKPPVFVLFLAGLATWQLASYFWSLDPVPTLTRVMTMVQLVAMVWLAGELCESEDERRRVLQAFVLGCVVVCYVLIQAYLSGQSIGGFRYAPRGFNPNESADIIAAGIPMALLAATSLRQPIFKWLNVAYVPLGVFAVILTASRSGFVATCLALTSVFFAIRQARPLYRLVWAVIIVAVFASLFYGLPLDSRLETNIERITFSTDTRSLLTFTGRTTIWSDGLAMFAERPMTGLGANTFSAALESRGGGWHAAHNIWVETAAETGVIGLVLLVAAVLAALVQGVKHRDYRRGFHVVLFLVLMTTSFVANFMISKGFWIGMAILAVTQWLPSGRFVPKAAYEEIPERVPAVGGSSP